MIQAAVALTNIEVNEESSDIPVNPMCCFFSLSSHSVVSERDFINHMNSSVLQRLSTKALRIKTAFHFFFYDSFCRD